MQPILGRYLPLRTFRGGMGVVHMALDLHEKHPVALKTFRPELLANVDARARFLHEANTWLALGAHPHVVPVHLIRSDEEQVFVIADFIEPIDGHAEPSLRAFVGRTSMTDALGLALGIVRGMLHATARVPGLVHRDLKPENVLVGRDGRARVTDFGLAGLREGDVGGTPRYMAPEQHRGHADARSDIYAVGLILDELAAGHPIARIATSADPAHRFQSWTELESALVDALGAAAPPPVSAEIASRAQRVLAGWSLNTLGNALDEIGHPRDAVTSLRMALDVARAEQDPPLEAASLHNLSHQLALLGEHDEAATALDHAIAIKRRLGDERGVARSIGQRASIHARRGHHDAALADSLHAVERLRALGFADDALGYLADAVSSLIALGRFDEAIAHGEPLPAQFTQRGQHKRAAMVLGSLGFVFRKLGRVVEALGASAAALAIFEQIGDQRGMAAELQIQGNTYLAGQNKVAAIGCFERSLALAEKLEDALLIGHNHYALANLTPRDPRFVAGGVMNAKRAAAAYDLAKRPDLAADARRLEQAIATAFPKTP